MSQVTDYVEEEGLGISRSGFAPCGSVFFLLSAHIPFTLLPPASKRSSSSTGQGHIHFSREPPALKTAVLQDNGTRNDGPVLLRSKLASEIIFCRECFDRVN